MAEHDERPEYSAPNPRQSGSTKPIGIAPVDTLRRRAIVLAPLWSDPLATPGDQFPMGPPAWWWEGSEDEPSKDPAVRPYSLRNLVAGPVASVNEGWSYEYDPTRQIGVARLADGTVVELNKHTKPGVTPAGTTGTQQDGDPRNPPPEEMGNKDYQTD